MTFTEEFAQAVRHQRMLMKHRPDRARFRVLIYALWTFFFGVAFAVLGGLQRGDLGAERWWREQLPGNLLVSACIMCCFFVVFRSFEKLAPQRWLDTIMGWHDWRSALFFSAVSIGCALLGIVIGFLLVDLIWNVPNLRYVLGNLGFWRQFFMVSAVISAVMVWRYRARWKQQQLQARVTEAQLRLLQGQIEPHFLFNTLANVQSLIDFDPDRAKLMLERFTDYLRASLGQLRGDSTTLAQEFAMLEAYLGLMQLRMGERLRVRLDLAEDLAGFELPPLLVQPLVENAIRHGIEPAPAGGELAIRCHGGEMLVVEVENSGCAFAPDERQGIGLANVRERLRACHGEQATLELEPHDGGGLLARIRLPFDDHAPAPDHR